MRSDLRFQRRSVQAERGSKARRTCETADHPCPLHYDVLWNSDRVPIVEIAKILIGMIRDKAAGRY